MPFPLLLPFLVMFTGCPCSWSRFYNHLNLHATTTTKKKFFNDFDWPVPASFLATPWHRFSKAKKMPSTITTPPGVLCQVDSKIKITDQWSENIWTFLNLEWLCKNLWTISLMMWFLPTLKGSQPYKVPTQPSTRFDHPFILLFFSSFLLWLIASFELIDLSYQLPKFFPWHTTITLKHFDQKNPNSSPGVLCQVDVCLMVLGDCFKIAFYIYFTRKIMTGHFKKPFFLPWMGCWTTKHYGYIL